MKALSVRQPFAYEILIGEKKYEFRSWQTNYRGDLLICATKLPKIKGMISGYAFVIVTLSDVIEITKDNCNEFGIERNELNGKLYAWHLTGGKIIKPIPVKGKLSLFNVDDDLIEILDNGDDSLTEEEAEAIYNKYFKPLES